MIQSKEKKRTIFIDSSQTINLLDQRQQLCKDKPEMTTNQGPWLLITGQFVYSPHSNSITDQASKNNLNSKIRMEYLGLIQHLIPYVYFRFQLGPL
jgi:hypothetical protein